MLHPRTLKEFMANRRRSAERKCKRALRVKELRGNKKTTSQERAILVHKCFELHSFAVRLRDKFNFAGKCPLCELRDRYPAKPIECCFHVFSRVYRRVAFDLRNGVGTCCGCNLTYEYDARFAGRVHEWYRATFGAEAFDKLSADSRGSANHSLDDLRAIKAGLEKAIELRRF